MNLDPPPPLRLEGLSDPLLFKQMLAVANHPLMERAHERYYPWRKFAPAARQAGLNPEPGWQWLKFRRLGCVRWPELTTTVGSHFSLVQPLSMSEALHTIDRATRGGGVAAFDSEEGVPKYPDQARRFVIRSLMDEAIESSRIEGAVVTREVARDILRSGREPENQHERMVINNYAAMQRIKDLLSRDLTPRMLLELQGVLTQGTLPPDKVGRFRTASDGPVAVVDARDNTEIYVPPPPELLPRRIDALCAFANTEHTGAAFVHPIVKACILHFMVGYDHPFVDGNGRTARAIFYWYALKSGYRVFEFLSISELIRAAYAKYPQAYVDTELDNGDLTYFVMYHLRVITRAIGQLSEYLRREEQQLDATLGLIKRHKDLNLRQRVLLEHACRKPRSVYTVRSHATSHGITPATARADLSRLVGIGYLTTSKRGREVTFHLDPAGAARLRKLMGI
jgi:Fic family protein